MSDKANFEINNPFRYYSSGSGNPTTDEVSSQRTEPSGNISNESITQTDGFNVPNDVTDNVNHEALQNRKIFAKHEPGTNNFSLKFLKLQRLMRETLDCSTWTLIKGMNFEKFKQIMHSPSDKKEELTVEFVNNALGGVINIVPQLSCILSEEDDIRPIIQIAIEKIAYSHDVSIFELQRSVLDGITRPHVESDNRLKRERELLLIFREQAQNFLNDPLWIHLEGMNFERFVHVVKFYQGACLPIFPLPSQEEHDVFEFYTKITNFITCNFIADNVLLKFDNTKDIRTRFKATLEAIIFREEDSFRDLKDLIECYFTI